MNEKPQKIKYSDREICANCQHWSSQYRYPYDAGTAAMCNKLSQERAHLSCKETVLMDDNAGGDKQSIIWTRHTFGCNLFERTK